ncbi:tetratricopeptide repeat protein [Phormidesmis sp. 146-12]
MQEAFKVLLIRGMNRWLKSVIFRSKSDEIIPSFSNAAFDWNEEPPFDLTIEYQGLLRGLRRKKGFGLYFVQCSPAEGTKLIARVRQDLPQKIEVLKFDGAMDGNFYQCVAEYLQAHGDTEVLFVQGLEYSLLSYEATKREEGWSSEETHSYSWKAVPRLLGNLNLQRERFRDNFPIRFVFLLPLFAMKYLIRRAPDFFDWRSGIYEFPTDSELLEQGSLRLLGNYDEYLTWTQAERNRRVAEIQCWASEPEQTAESKAKLFFEQGNIFYASKRYEGAIASYDEALKYKPDNHYAWNNRGNALRNLQRYEEAIASFDYALKIEPNDHEVWCDCGLALAYLQRYEEAITNFDYALKIRPDDARTFYNKACCYGLQSQADLAIANLKQAIDLNPKCCEMAKTDADFDGIREDDRFQSLLNESVE